MERQSPDLPEVPYTNADEAPGQHTFVRRVAQIWFHLSGPPANRFGNSLEDQERLRRSRLLSALVPFSLVSALITAPTAIPVPTYWIPIFSLLILSTAAILFNRAAYVNLAGIFFILAIDMTLVVLMITLPSGIRNSNIPDFDLFVIATLIGGIVLPRRILPFLAGVHIAIILALFIWLPHDSLLTQEVLINQKGFAYAELSDAFLLQIIGASVAWAAAWSVDKALLRASRAEELARAERRISDQTQLLALQKERLEYGITVVKEAHARFANGDYKARANLQDNELASLAFSFNLLAERLNRIAQIAQEHERMEMALQQFFSAQDTIIHGGTPRPLLPTGTIVDRLHPWLKQYAQLRHAYLQSGFLLEKMRLSLTRQRTLLTQLTLSLDQIHGLLRLASADTKEAWSSMLLFLEKAQQFCGQVEEQERNCLQETRLLEQQLRGAQLGNINAPSDVL